MSEDKKSLVENLEQAMTSSASFEEMSPGVMELRTKYVSLLKNLHDEELKVFLKEGGEEGAFKPSHDDLDGKFSELMAKFNQQKKTFDDQRAHEEIQNLEAKKKIISELEKLVEEEHHIGPAFAKFNELKEQWKTVGNVPAKEFKELQHDYSLILEKFFYNINIYKTLKEYDLEKNLKLKQDLIEKVKALDKNDNIKEVRDLISTYTKEWDEVGPTHQSKWEGVRDEFWSEVREVHKKITDHYKGIKEDQKLNFEKKEKLCEELELLSKQEVQDMKELNKLLKRMDHLREEWKKIGFAGKGKNDRVWKRFREAGNTLYEKRKSFQDDMKDVYKQHEEKKLKLIDEAEALKDSMDWKKTADSFKRLQVQWKKIGPAHPMREQKLWKRFRASTDHFFNARKAFFDGREERESNNLKSKNALIAKIKKLKVDQDSEAAKKVLEGIVKEWNTIGYVPAGEKEKLNKDFDQLLKKTFKAIGLAENEIEQETFKYKLEGIKESDNASELLRNEYHSLSEKLRKIESQVQQYENNLGFFGGNVEGNPLIAEVQKNLEASKKEAELIKEKMTRLTD